jgi:transcriptional regulator with XRE-family HTH domain
MAKTLKEKMDSLSPERRKKIEAMTAELITDEKSLRDLRHALALTQEHMAEVLGVGQESVSRLEKRSDLLLSTLRGYVKAMGGELRLVAEFPNRPPVLLKGFAAMNAEIRPAVAENGDPNDFGTHPN